jgi:hypothetical protein
MVDPRQFIRNLGDQAPNYFGTTEKTIKRWLKTGQLPIKAFQKIELAVQATRPADPALAQPQDPATTQPADPPLDPYTKLPLNIDRRLPEIQVEGGGKLPPVIEMSPTEQSFGVNLTRPGRLSNTVMPPMKIKEEGGQKIAYVDTEPPKPIVLPPTMQTDAGWASKGPPMPEPKKPDEPRTKKIKAKSVS